MSRIIISAILILTVQLQTWAQQCWLALFKIHKQCFRGWGWARYRLEILMQGVILITRFWQLVLLECVLIFHPLSCFITQFVLPMIILFLLAPRWLTYIHGSRTSLFRIQQHGHTNSSSRMMWLFPVTWQISLPCILLRLDGQPWVVLKNFPPFPRERNKIWLFIYIYRIRRLQRLNRMELQLLL